MLTIEKGKWIQKQNQIEFTCLKLSTYRMNQLLSCPCFEKLTSIGGKVVDFQPTQESLMFIFKHTPNLKRLSLECINYTNDMILYLSTNCKDIALMHCFREIYSFKLILNCWNLRIIRLEKPFEWNLTDEIYPNISEIQLCNDISLHNINYHFPNITILLYNKVLSLNEENIQNYINTLKLVKIIRIKIIGNISETNYLEFLQNCLPNCNYLCTNNILTDNGLKQLIDMKKSMKSLTLHPTQSYPLITDISINYLFEITNNLLFLDISYCKLLTNISYESLKINNIEKLAINGLLISDITLINISKKCLKLEKFELFEMNQFITEYGYRHVFELLDSNRGSFHNQNYFLPKFIYDFSKKYENLKVCGIIEII